MGRLLLLNKTYSVMRVDEILEQNLGELDGSMRQEFLALKGSLVPKLHLLLEHMYYKQDSNLAHWVDNVKVFPTETQFKGRGIWIRHKNRRVESGASSVEHSGGGGEQELGLTREMLIQRVQSQFKVDNFKDVIHKFDSVLPPDNAPPTVDDGGSDDDDDDDNHHDYTFEPPSDDEEEHGSTSVGRKRTRSSMSVTLDQEQQREGSSDDGAERNHHEEPDGSEETGEEELSTTDALAHKNKRRRTSGAGSESDVKKKVIEEQRMKIARIDNDVINIEHQMAQLAAKRKQKIREKMALEGIIETLLSQLSQ